MSSDQTAGLSKREWADAPLTLTKIETAEPEEAIYELRKMVVINGVPHVQYVWLNQASCNRGRRPSAHPAEWADRRP
jgi:hypothetical protein